MLKKAFTRSVAFRQLTLGQYKALRFFSEVKTEKLNKSFNKAASKDEKEMIIEEVMEMEPELKEIRDQLIKDLQLQRQNTAQKEATQKELRDAILYEEVLRKEVDIPLYDCGNFTFRAYYFGNILLFLLGCGLTLYFYYAPHIKDSKKWLYYLPCVLFSLGRIQYFRNFQKHFVQSVVYNTKDKDFTLMTRGFAYGKKYYEKVQKGDLMYTEDPVLNKRRINYINMRTLNLYCIGYKYGWKNKELFSHLIAQRIK